MTEASLAWEWKDLSPWEHPCPLQGTGASAFTARPPCENNPEYPKLLSGLDVGEMVKARASPGSARTPWLIQGPSARAMAGPHQAPGSASLLGGLPEEPPSSEHFSSSCTLDFSLAKTLAGESKRWYEAMIWGGKGG